MVLLNTPGPVQACAHNAAETKATETKAADANATDTKAADAKAAVDSVHTHDATVVE
jgi:hypothetical protein